MTKTNDYSTVLTYTALLLLADKPTVTRKSSYKIPTREERTWMNQILSYGCICCKMDGISRVDTDDRETVAYELKKDGKKLGRLFTIPLCEPGHLRDGAEFGMISRHPWQSEFTARYGTEEELLDRLRAEIKQQNIRRPYTKRKQREVSRETNG